jgi:prevent-host-death family protein
MDVGIRELKKHLSEYVEKAARGEMMRVTLRGKPVAHLGPLPGRVRLDQGIDEGWITPGGTHDPVEFEPEPSTMSVSGALGEDRGV